LRIKNPENTTGGREMIEMSVEARDREQIERGRF
jgi:hypothetical protein